MARPSSQRRRRTSLSGTIQIVSDPAGLPLSDRLPIRRAQSAAGGAGAARGAMAVDQPGPASPPAIGPDCDAVRWPGAVAARLALAGASAAERGGGGSPAALHPARPALRIGHLAIADGQAAGPGNDLPPARPPGDEGD